MADRTQGGSDHWVEGTPVFHKWYMAVPRKRGNCETGPRLRPAAVACPAMVTMEKIVALCKRRGFVFPASEIYGGIANTYDYGHYGVLLKNNVSASGGRR